MARGRNVPHAVRERALDLWASTTGMSGVGIAEAVGIRHGTLSTIVARARAAGDARAIHRQAGPLLGSRNRAAKPRPDRALNLWATDPGMSASEIAAAAGMKLAAFNSLIQRARKAGDPRAVYRDGKPVRAPTGRAASPERSGTTSSLPGRRASTARPAPPGTVSTLTMSIRSCAGPANPTTPEPSGVAP